MTVISFAPSVMMSAVIAMSIDYSLFLLSRWVHNHTFVQGLACCIEANVSTATPQTRSVAPQSAIAREGADDHLVCICRRILHIAHGNVGSRRCRGARRLALQTSQGRSCSPPAGLGRPFHAMGGWSCTTDLMFLAWVRVSVSLNTHRSSNRPYCSHMHACSHKYFHILKLHACFKGSQQHRACTKSRARGPRFARGCWACAYTPVPQRGDPLPQRAYTPLPYPA
jgi:hypothetical protein